MSNLLESILHELEQALTENRAEYILKHQKDKILQVLKQDTTSEAKTPEQVVSTLQAIDTKHLQWLVNQYIQSKFRLEDSARVKDVITNFNQLRNQLQKKDINQYDLHQLEDELDKLTPKQTKGEQERQIKSTEAEKVLDTPNYLVIHPKTEAAACYYGKGTKWCTAADKNNAFGHYNRSGPLYIIIDKKTQDKWQVHDKNEQFMDVKDRKISKKQLEIFLQDDKLGKFLKTNTINALRLDIFTKDDVLRSKNIKLMYKYAKDVIKGRWPEAEPYIMKDPEHAYNYARTIIKGRWPEAEPYIMKEAEYASLYAHEVIKGRWPEAEPYIMKDPLCIYFYAKDLIKGRWPEAEPYIKQNEYFRDEYTKHFKLGKI